MPSNYTPNYSLNQWEPDDRVQRADFNADNAKIDAAIKAVDQRADSLSIQKADASALNALKTTVDKKADKTALAAAEARIPRIITGSFTGTGSADPVHISIGARPRILVIATNNHIGNSNEVGRIVFENGINIKFLDINDPYVSLTGPITFNDDGFTITFTESPDRSYNRKGYEQRYWVLV